MILNDFPDRLSPMLVKELRQGLRTKSFVVLFIALQVLLCFILLTATTSQDSRNAGTSASGTIFTLFCLALLVFQPLRGVGAMGNEITGNTIELMVLTRLNSTRILLGKWMSIVSQSALILITVIPYLILRYFFGGMNIIGELVLLMLIFLTSAAATAIIVGLSATGAKIMRFLPIVFIIFAATALPRMMIFGGGSNLISTAAMEDPDDWIKLALYIGIISYMAWCALSWGISATAPAAENHATVRRLVAIVLTLAVSTVIAFDVVDPEMASLLFGIILIPVIFMAITEQSYLLPPVCTPFLKRGIIGKIAGFFLYPGWPSGVFFTALVAAIVGLTFLFKDGLLTVHEAIRISSAFGTLLLPALLSAIFTKDENKRFTHYLIFAISLIIVNIIAVTCINVWGQKELVWLFVWNPLTFFIDKYSFPSANIRLAFAGIVNGGILLLFIIRAVIAYQGYKEVFKIAQESLAVPHPDA